MVTAPAPRLGRPRRLAHLGRWLDGALSVLEHTAVAGLFLLAVALLAMDIALRVTVNEALSWAAEAARNAIVGMVFIGSSIAARRGSHISIDALPECLPPKAASLLRRLLAGVSALACVLLAYYGSLLVVQMMTFRQVSPALEIPMWTVYCAIPMGFGLMALRFAQGALAPPRQGASPAERQVD